MTRKAGVDPGANAAYSVPVKPLRPLNPGPAEGASHRDHSHCAHDPARAHGHGVDLTPARRRVLDELCAAGAPLGAYDMIDRLAAGTGKRPAPISVYRALDFLVEKGLVHRLASRNAFMACEHGHGAHEPAIFLICDTCGAVTEATSRAAAESLRGVAEGAGFTPRAQVIELAGVCARCQSAAPS